MKAISLFTSSGIGDLGLKANSIDTLIACELLPERCKLFMNNFPKAKCFCGNIWDLQKDIINEYQSKYQDDLDLIIATPPCQGMSPNGMGKMLNLFRKGERPEMDERNRLIIPALNIIKELRPKWVIFENVVNMENTIIVNENGEAVNIISYIKERLGHEYIGGPNIVDCADYGIPQHRMRLITIYSRTTKANKYFAQHNTFMPEPTHSKESSIFTKKHLTVRDAIGGLPELRAEKGRNIDKSNSLHKVPILDVTKLWWIDNTKEGDTAFNNQCTNPKCNYSKNAIHGTIKKNGINEAKKDTPLFCEMCGALLPRPSVVDKKTGELRIMNAFTSAYKRMSWDSPASTLTQNFQYACSDNKIHPSQSRTLSIFEALIIQTIANYEYSFEIEGKQVSDSLIRDTIGESVPPKLIDVICKNIREIDYL